jgi:uncharacterized repeat protein (TIGR03803 family)
LRSDGNFYGTSLNIMGTVFKITPTGTFTTLYSFCSQPDCPDGQALSHALIQAKDGNFYGVTDMGGSNDQGTAFKLSLGGALTTLHSFCSQPDCADGYQATGLMQATDGNFYGTTYVGGANGSGTFYTLTSEGTLTTLYNFCSQVYCSDGSSPMQLVQGTDGNFYGAALQGGPLNYGTIYRITSEGVLTTLYTFCSLPNCADGKWPISPIQASDGNFYGVTVEGGANGYGTVYKITPAGALTTLYNFCSQPNCADGRQPLRSLIQASDGNLYGATGGWSSDVAGTLFKITPTGTLTTLYTFCSQPSCADGVNPTGLMQAKDGNLYGTTFGGGAYTDNGYLGGTIFRFSLSMTGPAITFSPSALRFGKQAINQNSNPKTVKVTNTGTATLDLTSITSSGDDFWISAYTCGSTLAVGRTCKVKVRFTPSQLSTRTGALVFVDNAPSSPQTVPLSGVGVPPAILTPASATYASLKVGTTSPAKTFTLRNYQLVPLNNIAISTSGDFAVSATTCGLSLPAKAACTISVTFTPTQTGTRSGQLQVSDSAGNSPQTASLTGTGK